MTSLYWHTLVLILLILAFIVSKLHESNVFLITWFLYVQFLRENLMSMFTSSPRNFVRPKQFHGKIN